jgi:6-pyruvoyltetrahydropterin/6-carboxytetrahydropterin synthase
MAYTIRKKFTFEAAHQLVDHDGKCARLHGHSWVAWVEVQGTEVHLDGPKRNMLVDFADVKSAVKPLVDGYLDHHHLNDTLECDMPTSEYVAKWLFDKVANLMPGLAAVEIEETCTSMCRYQP